MNRLRLTVGAQSFELELLDTPTARALLAAAPFESNAQTWGEEVYFSTPVSAKLEPGAQQVVEPGTACFWTEGKAIALPFGRTPISDTDKPKLASRCNVLGTLEDSRRLGKVKPGDRIRVEKV